ncbi:VOC family protein [Sulfidibacter corallicola]|uniref:VOC family protein n=1 Tax=Sulfidibacter corallicola TaxID=2818388 RepID=A0A8A4TIK6_SULCO|nr:VOC family protein [Sulfidibacter corallicola]QTD48982.1 VOC family protein [Sulfidibacter corallicola]
MIGYTTLGTNDLEKATAFYDQLFSDMDAKKMFDTETFVGWQLGQGAMFSITKPYDKNEATVGNGVMIALKVDGPATVDALHAKAMSLGAANEGDPGERIEGFYAGYFRDLDGNKLNFFSYG